MLHFLLMLCLACTTCMHMYGVHALNISGTSKYSCDLACMQADMILVKITASHFQVLNTQNANQNMPNMIPIAYLNKNFINCNENLAWVDKNPLFIPTCFGTKQKVKRGKNFILHSFHVVIMTFKSFQITFSTEYQHTSTFEHC